MDKIKSLATNLLELEDKKLKLLLEITATHNALTKAYCEAIGESGEPDGWIGETFLFNHNDKVYKLSFSESEFSDLKDTQAQFI